MGYGFVAIFNSSTFRSIHKGINFENLFSVFLLLALLYGIFTQCRDIYLVLRPPLPAGLELTPGKIIYWTGTKRLKVKIGRGGGGPPDGIPEKLKSKTYVLPLKEKENFALERIGDYLRLSFEYEDEAIEVGSRLKDADKEWLYKSLGEFK